MSTKSSNFDIYIGQSLGLLISVPSALLYLLECWTILRNWKQFNSSFYKLFLLSAFNNLFMNFAPSFLYARLIRLGWVNQLYLGSPVWMPNLLCFIMYYNYHCENVATIFTLLHRLTVIANPLSYEKHWHYLLPVSAVCIFVSPLAFTYRLLMWPMFFGQNTDKSIEISVNSSAFRAQDLPTFTNFKMMLATSVGYLLVNCVLNVAVYLLYKKKQGKFSLNNDKSSRLLAYAIAIFMAQLLLCIFWLLLTLQQMTAIFPAQFNSYLPNQYVWMNDIRTVAFPAWFLLWASAELNQRVKQLVSWLPSFRMSVGSSSNQVHPAVIGGGGGGDARGSRGGNKVVVMPALSRSTSSLQNNNPPFYTSRGPQQQRQQSATASQMFSAMPSSSRRPSQQSHLQMAQVEAVNCVNNGGSSSRSHRSSRS